MNSGVSKQIYDGCVISAREYTIIILDTYSKEFKCRSTTRIICEKKAEQSLFSHENKSHEL